MANDFYKKAFDAALEELTALYRQRSVLASEIDEIDERIDAVRQGALGLIPLSDVDFTEIKEKYPDLFEEQIDTRMGITDAVREALRGIPDTITPIEIRDRVFQISPVIAGQKNPLASIHTVLRRLVEKGDVLDFVYPEGMTRYAWIGGPDWEERIRKLAKDPESVIELIKEKRKGKRKKQEG